MVKVNVITSECRLQQIKSDAIKCNLRSHNHVNHAIFLTSYKFFVSGIILLLPTLNPC